MQIDETDPEQKRDRQAVKVLIRLVDLRKALLQEPSCYKDHRENSDIRQGQFQIIAERGISVNDPDSNFLFLECCIHIAAEQNDQNHDQDRSKDLQKAVLIGSKAVQRIDVPYLPDTGLAVFLRSDQIPVYQLFSRVRIQFFPWRKPDILGNENNVLVLPFLIPKCFCRSEILSLSV